MNELGAEPWHGEAATLGRLLRLFERPVASRNAGAG
jgi:hypothetical protein